jgi:5-methylcytosine-specific restriction endonuclease McrA
MGYRRKSKAAERKEKERNLQKMLSSIRKYRLTSAELLLLKKEVTTVPNHISPLRKKLSEEIESLEKKRDELTSSIYYRKESMLDAELKESADAASEAVKYSNLWGQTLFRAEKKDAENRGKKASDRYNLLLNQIQHEQKEAGTPINKEIYQLKRQLGEIRLWQGMSAPLLSKEVLFRGMKKNLGDDLLSHFPLGSGLLLEGIDLAIVEVKKNEKTDALKAKAASSEMKVRQIANSVKKIILGQFDILKLCPYCGNNFELEGAHADHIYPVSKGGHSTIKNMVYVCETCNSKKGKLTLNKFIKQEGYDRKSIESRLDLLKKDF